MEGKLVQKQNYDRRHKTSELPPITTGDKVWVIDLKRYGRVIERISERSYTIFTEIGNVRRNRVNLIPVEKPKTFPVSDAIGSQPLQRDAELRTRTPLRSQCSAEPRSTPTKVARSPNIDPTLGKFTRSGREIKEPRKLNL
jgi:hypothetical protein